MFGILVSQTCVQPNKKASLTSSQDSNPGNYFDITGLLAGETAEKN